MERLSCKLEIVFCSLMLELIQSFFFAYTAFREGIIEFLVDELNQALAVVSPQLATYLKQFTFDEFNTKVMESDA